MAKVLALIPARSGSRGIPNKNFTPLGGDDPNDTPLGRAILTCWTSGVVHQLVVSTDRERADPTLNMEDEGLFYLRRPPELAQDDTPMIDVVKHALAEIPGPDDQIILLVQPTQPLRQPNHLTAAIQLLEETKADSVVSVVELPLTHKPPFVCFIPRDGSLLPYYNSWAEMPTTRQAPHPAYIRDGTVYAFWRCTVTQYGTIYGKDVRPLIIDSSETCALDTMADWHEAERRLKARDAV